MLSLSFTFAKHNKILKVININDRVRVIQKVVRIQIYIAHISS